MRATDGAAVVAAGTRSCATGQGGATPTSPRVSSQLTVPSAMSLTPLGVGPAGPSQEGSDASAVVAALASAGAGEGEAVISLFSGHGTCGQYGGVCACERACVCV